MKSKARPAPRGFVQRALAGHAAIGLLASALIYIIALTGTLAVIHERWQRWEQPDIAETAVITPAAVQRAAEAAIANEAGMPKTKHLFVHLPSDSLPRTVVTTDNKAVYVDGEGRIVAPEAHGWTEFLLALHIHLTLPMTLGLIVVGAMGAMLVTLLLTGVAAHPRIFRDAFRLRARSSQQLARTDWHNRLGVWTLPFALAIALTGAFIGLANVGASLIAKAHYGGDVERAYAPVFGHEPPPDLRLAPLPDMAAALETMRARFPARKPTYVIVHDPGTVGQRVQILAIYERRLIYGESYFFNAGGLFTGITNLSGGPIGRQVAASAYGLHFGSYGGLPVEILYMILGFALCAISATGTTLWLHKRRRRGAASPRLEATWTTLLWGVPILIVALLWVRAGFGAGVPFATLFWTGLFAATAAALARPDFVHPMKLRRALAAMLLLTGVGHGLVQSSMQTDILALDLGLAAVATLLFALDFRWIRDTEQGQLAAEGSP